MDSTIKYVFAHPSLGLASTLFLGRLATPPSPPSPTIHLLPSSPHTIIIGYTLTKLTVNLYLFWPKSHH